MTGSENSQNNIVSSLDVRGMVCSKPVIKIKVQLKKMQLSETLEVIASHNNYKDLKRLFGDAQGHHIEEVHQGESVILLITKT